MAAYPKPFHPEVLYAERSSATEPEKNIIYLTFNVPNIQGEPNLDVNPGQISFSAKSGNPDKGIPEKEWACDIDLWGEIIPSETKKQHNERHLMLILRKKEPKAEYWPRLTKEKPNRNWIKTDFSKWVDEDEQEEQPEDNMGDMGGMGDMASMMGGMGGMGGGMPGMPGMGGGMPGMPGMGGAGGMDFAQMMQQMGGMGAMGGAGGMPDLGALGGDDDGDLDEVAGEKAAEGDKPAAGEEASKAEETK